MSDITWVDELPSQRPHRSSKYEAFAAALRANPGRWAQWPRAYKNSSTPSAIRKGILDNTDPAPPPFRTGRWEAVVRQGNLYVRYLGE